MTKSNVNPNHYKVAGRERQGEDIPQARNKQKHAESLVAARTGPHARFAKTRPAPVMRPMGADPALSATKTAKKATKKTAKKATKKATRKATKKGTKKASAATGKA
jgi:hypothetical protein